MSWSELSWPAGLLLAAALVYSIARGIHIHIHRYNETDRDDDESGPDGERSPDAPTHRQAAMVQLAASLLRVALGMQAPYGPDSQAPRAMAMRRRH